MMRLTNSEIQARKTPEMLASERGGLGSVSQMLMLKKSYQLVWRGKDAEIRDNARSNSIVFSGTYAECVAEAQRRGIWIR